MAISTLPRRGPDANALTGRDEELRRLAEALATARSGHPCVVVIEGPGGIGKTALIRRFAADHKDVRLLWAAGDASERTVPFGLADQLLRRARPDDPPAAGLLADPSQYTAVGLAILEALGELQRSGPVVLVVDDAHWADPGSLRAVLFALRRLVADTVLVIVAARTEHLHVLPDGLTRTAERLRLRPLPFNAVRALARRRELPLSAHALRRVHELSAGVPLHLCALLDEWAATRDFERITAPPSFAALIVGRLSECGDVARRLVEAAAVLGRRASIDDVALLAEVQEPLPGLEEAVARDLLRVANRSIEFVHPLIRSAVHDALGPARLAELHAAAAELVEDPSAALQHRAQAATMPDARLARELEAAARQAADSGNWLRAADFLTEAADLSTTVADRERRVLDSVSAFCEAGDLVTARSMVARIRSFGLSAEREFILGRVALSSLDVRTAQRHFEAAWAARPADAAPLGMWIATELSSCAYFLADARGHLDWARQAVKLASASDQPAVSRLAQALAMAGRLDEGLELLERAVTAAGSRDLTLLQLARGRLRLVDDDLASARTDLSAVAATIRGGSSRAAGLALGRLGFVEYCAGRWDLALQHADQGLSACVDRTDNAQLSAVRTPAVLVLAARGAWPAAEQHHQAMQLESGNAQLPALYIASAGARLAAAKGDPAGVLSALAPVLALSSRDFVDEPGFWPWQDVYAEALVELGQLDEVERFLPHHETLARERGRVSMIGRLARARGRLEAARGNDAVAEEAFALSTRALESMPYERALTELAHGQFLRRRRRRRAAVEVLANARDCFAAVGARPALERCERELQASGLTPKRPAAKGPGRLTPQELTVARLVIAGMTNREIASELMVSSKTVEVHLTSVYAKLEVPSRTELRARARRGELRDLDASA